MNLYAYVGNSPLMATDPSGMAFQGGRIDNQRRRNQEEDDDNAPDLWAMHTYAEGESTLVPYYVQSRMERTAQGEFGWVDYAVPGVDPGMAEVSARLTAILLGPTFGRSFGFSGSAQVTVRTGLSVTAVSRGRDLANLSGEIRTTKTVAGHSSSRGYVTVGSIRHAV